MRTFRKMTADDREFRKLNRALQRFCRRNDVRSKLKKLHPHSAESEMESGVIRNCVDLDQTGKVPALIHELLHWFYEKETSHIPYAIHEGWIADTERKLFEFLQGDKRRMNWWRREFKRTMR